MKQKRFRNHFSSIVEQIWSLIFLVLIICGNRISEEVESANEKTDTIHLFEQNFWIVAIVLFFFFIVLGYTIIIWSRTYISIDKDTITIERNTLNRRIYTIGMRNIANVNIEQNLFERIIGTCKLKLDTNTLSTANETDVSIILKKDMAEQLKSEIMKCLQYDIEDLETNLYKKERETIDDQYTIERSYQYEASKKDMIWNSICQLSWGTLCVFISTFSVGILNLIKIIEALRTGQNHAGLGIKFILMVAFIGSGIWTLIKSFFDYGDFKVIREKDKLYLTYGLLKKVEYALPIDKMNGLVIKQTLIARLLGRYIVEAINIGSSDEAGEIGNRLGLACKKEEMNRLVEALLPEYQVTQIEKIQRQPRLAMILQGIKYMISIGIAIVVIVLGAKVLDKDLGQIDQWIQMSLFIAVFVLALIRILLGYYSKGIYIGERHMIIAQGVLRKEIVILRYDKIQYVKINDNSLSRVWGIAKGNVYLLAGLLNQRKSIPYCLMEELEQMAYKVVGYSGKKR